MKIEIPQPILDFAKFTAPHMTPLERKSGWKEQTTERRGNGDLFDLIGSLMMFNELGKRNKICSVDLSCGIGDEKDIAISIGNEMKKFNIKTSGYGPFTNNLRLFVKEEELDKDIDAYIQCFIHLDAKKLDGELITPHVHFAGWVATNSPVWKKSSISVIPNTGGHKGVGITISKLGPMEGLFSIADDKF